MTASNPTNNPSNNLTTYMAMAQYYTDEPGRRPFKGDYPRCMGFYEAATPQEAFAKFIEEFAPNGHEAQVFYNQVTMVPCLTAQGYQFKMDSVYPGDLFRFPNPKAVHKE